MERPGRTTTSVYQRNGAKVELLLIKEQEHRELGIAPTTGIFQHQIQAAMKTMAYLRNPTNPKPALVIAPTGSGKTGILGLLPYLMRSRRVMVLTPSPIISAQIEKAVALPSSLSNFFEKTGCFPGWNDDDKSTFLPQALLVRHSDEIARQYFDLTIVNAQRLGGNSRTNARNVDNDEVYARLAGFFRNVDLLIVDEAHHFPAPTWLNIKMAYESINPGKDMVFITATAERMWQGRIARILPRTHDAFVVTRDELEGDVRRRLEFVELPHISIGMTMDLKTDLVVQVMTKLSEHDQNEDRFRHQAMVTVRTTAEALELSNIFNEIYPNSSKAITGGNNVNVDEIEEFKNGRFRVAVVCKMLVEGYDNPSISVCAIFKINNSQLFFEQFLGRCLRRMRFTNGPPDRTQAAMISYRRFGQRAHYEAIYGRNPVVVEDYSEDEDEEEMR